MEEQENVLLKLNPPESAEFGVKLYYFIMLFTGIGYFILLIIRFALFGTEDYDVYSFLFTLVMICMILYPILDVFLGSNVVVLVTEDKVIREATKRHLNRPPKRRALLIKDISFIEDNVDYVEIVTLGDKERGWNYYDGEDVKKYDFFPKKKDHIRWNFDENDENKQKLIEILSDKIPLIEHPKIEDLYYRKYNKAPMD